MFMDIHRMGYMFTVVEKTPTEVFSDFPHRTVRL